MELEKLATAAVMTEIAKTDRLSSFINSGDKEPCWDGNIYIHEGKDLTKKNIKKVATQVKGKAVTVKKIKDIIKYPISYDDLHAYMMNGGTLFFVVYLDNQNGNVLQIYYANLLPVKIKAILVDKKKSYRLEFKKFPNDNLQKTELLLNFYENAQKQASFAGKDLPSIEELSKQGVLESLSIHYTGYRKSFKQFVLPKMLDGKSITIYANVKGGIAPIPVEYYENIDQITMCSYMKMPVSVQGKIYYDEIKVVTTASTFELYIGSCLEVVIPNTEEKTNSVIVKVNIKGTLKEQICGIEFVSAIIENGSFLVEKQEFASEFSEEELNMLRAGEFHDILTGYKRVQLLLDSMNVKKDLNIQACTEEDIRKLNFLIAALEERRPVKNHPENAGEVQNFSIANLNLAVVYLKNSNGKYYMWDYFGNHFDVSWQVEGNGIMKISQFSSMIAEDFLKYDNLNLQNIADDYKMIEPSGLLYELGNTTMLEILKAYDTKPTAELLATAKIMSEWLRTRPDYISDEVLVINNLQIILRERSLTFNEKASLHKIILETKDDFFRLGAFLLLDEQEEAKKLLSTFDEEQVKCFKTLPIYKFHRYAES